MGRVLRLGNLKYEDGDSDNNKGGGGEGWYNNDSVNGEKCDVDGREEVSDDHRGK